MTSSVFEIMQEAYQTANALPEVTPLSMMLDVDTGEQNALELSLHNKLTTLNGLQRGYDALKACHDQVMKYKDQGGISPLASDFIRITLNTVRDYLPEDVDLSYIPTLEHFEGDAQCSKLSEYTAEGLVENIKKVVKKIIDVCMSIYSAIVAWFKSNDRHLDKTRRAIKAMIDYHATGKSRTSRTGRLNGIYELRGISKRGHNSDFSECLSVFNFLFSEVLENSGFDILLGISAFSTNAPNNQYWQQVKDQLAADFHPKGKAEFYDSRERLLGATGSGAVGGGSHENKFRFQKPAEVLYLEIEASWPANAVDYAFTKFKVSPIETPADIETISKDSGNDVVEKLQQLIQLYDKMIAFSKTQQDFHKRVQKDLNTLQNSIPKITEKGAPEDEVVKIISELTASLSSIGTAGRDGVRLIDHDIRRYVRFAYDCIMLL